MENKNIKKIKEEIENIKNKKKVIDNTCKLQRDVINKDYKIKEELEKTQKNFNGFMEMYNGVNEHGLENIPNNEFDDYIRPIRMLNESTQLYNSLPTTIQDNYNNTDNLLSKLTTAGSSVNTSTADGLSFFKDHPSYSNTYERVEKNLNIYAEIKKQIEYINSQLQIINPDIKKEFEYFIKKVGIFETDTEKYQDIIGVRSTLFFKLIFESSRDITRKEGIKNFIFGSNITACDELGENITDEAYNLYRELSSQDETGMSVKLGNVTKSYINSLKHRIVGAFYRVLKLRENNYVA